MAALCEDRRAAQRIASAQTIAAVERLARSDRVHAARPEQWDANPWLLNTPGGIVDLRSGMIRPTRPEDYTIKMTAVAPGGECPIWLAFLERVTCGNSAFQSYLQRFAGYTLTGSTREQCLAFLYGTGANGKSTFLQTLSGMMGEYAMTAPVDLLTDTKFNGHPTEVAGLQGARLVTAVETGEGHRWNESRLKLLTGGDQLTARFMRGDFFSFVPTFKFLIAGNHRPTLRTVDEAMRRRLHLLPFLANIASGDRDPELPEKLKSEWPGILRWTIAGSVTWFRDGLCAPEVVCRASLDYLEAEDTLQQWIDDHCDLRNGEWSASSALFVDWRRYAEDAGEQAGTMKAFSQRLATYGLTPVRKSERRGFSGIRLKVVRRQI